MKAGAECSDCAQQVKVTLYSARAINHALAAARSSVGPTAIQAVETLVERLWKTSPASLSRAMQRRAKKWSAKPDWHKIKGGPLAGAELYLPDVTEGAWVDIVEGTFDAFLYEAIKPIPGLIPGTWWDIGAHIGYHTLGFAGLGADVIAFEPNTFNAQRLKDNLLRNPQLARHVQHLPVAVSDRDGETTFVQSGDLAGGSSGSHLANAMPPLAASAYEGFQSLSVKTARIDTLVSQGLTPPKLIKIDIEGAEHLALLGGRSLLKTHRPVLLVEVHHICLMFHIQELLLEVGYHARILDQEHAEPSRCFILAEPR